MGHLSPNDPNLSYWGGPSSTRCSICQTSVIQRHRHNPWSRLCHETRCSAESESAVCSWIDALRAQSDLHPSDECCCLLTGHVPYVLIHKARVGDADGLRRHVSFKRWDIPANHGLPAGLNHTTISSINALRVQVIVCVFIRLWLYFASVLNFGD